MAHAPLVKLGNTLNSTTNVIHSPSEHGGMIAYVTAASGTPVCTVDAMLNGGTVWEQINCTQRDLATLTKTARAAGTAITLVVSDVLYIPCQGYRSVRLKYSSGTFATIDMIACESVIDDIIDQLGLSITSIVPGTAATNLGKAEDAAHTTGDVGVMALGVRAATAADLSAGGTDGDYEPAQFDAKGRLWTMVPVFATVASFEKQGSATASQFAAIAGPLLCKIKAAYDNAGRVYIGTSTVTKKDGTTDTTTGFELSAGDETPWLPLTNTNLLYLICDNAGDDITALVLSG